MEILRMGGGKIDYLKTRGKWMTKFLIFLLIIGGLFFTWVGMTTKTSLYTKCMKDYNNNDKCTCLSNKFIDTFGGATLTGLNVLTQDKLSNDTYSASLKACNISDTDLVIEAIKQEVINKLFK